MTNQEKGISYTLIATALMSLDAVFVRLSGLHGFAPSFLFGAFSLISMLAMTRMKEGSILMAARASGLVLVFSGILMGISGTAFVLAIQKTTVANALLIMSLQPFFASIFSRLFLKETIDAKTGMAILISMIGMYIIVSGSLAGGGWVGDGLALVCATAVALNFVLYRKYPKLSRSLAVAAGGFFIALFSAAFVAPDDFDWKGIVIMAVMGLFTAPIGRMLLATSARYIPAPEISLIGQIKVFLAPMIIWAIFSELPSQQTFIGGGLILLAAIGRSALSLLDARTSKAKKSARAAAGA